MNATIVSSVVISVFLIFVILGFVFGWFRGLSKSLLRFIMVLGVGVLAFFVIPPISEALLNLDISKWNIVIGEVQVITIKDLITDLLRQVPFIEDIIESSATFETFVEVLPSMIANVLLFILFFFIFKWVSMIVYWIISGIFFSKKKMGDKEKHGFVGAVIGALQGFVVACIVLVPCFGLVETASPFFNAAMSQEQQTQTQTSFIDGVYYVDGEPEGAGSQEGQTDQIQDTLKDVSKYTEAFDNTWVVKMLDALGIKTLSVNMFDKLSTVEERGVEYSLMRETEAVANAYPELKVVMDSGFDIEDNDTLEALKGAINDLYQSPVLSGMVKEIVPEVASRWNNGATFCEISKPTFDDASIQRLFDALLVNLSTSTGDTVKNDVTTGVDLLMIANDANLLKTIAENGDIIDLLSQEGNENLIGDIISKALESETLKAVLPDLINVAMDFVYRALDIDPTTITDVSSNATINWEEEKPRLQNIFTNVISIVDDIKDGASAEPPVSALESLDFAKLGTTFDNIRLSTLLAPPSKEIMNALLTNTNIVGEDNEVLDTFVAKLNDVWTDPTVSLERTFVSIGDALKLARDMQNLETEFDASNIGQILTDIANSGDMLIDVVNEVVTTETLGKLGLDEQTAGVVSETVSKVINGDYSDGSGNTLANEVKAVEEVYNIANKVINLDTTTNPEAVASVDETEAKSLITALSESTILLDAITDAESNVGNLNIDEKLSTDSKKNILTEINKLEDTDPAKAKLLSLFGLSA